MVEKGDQVLWNRPRTFLEAGAVGGIATSCKNSKALWKYCIITTIIYNAFLLQMIKQILKFLLTKSPLCIFDILLSVNFYLCNFCKKVNIEMMTHQFRQF